MATPNKATNANGPLWVIAALLAVIAACLVALVVHQNHRIDYKVIEPTDLASTAASEPPKPIPPMRLHIQPVAVATPIPNPANDGLSSAELPANSQPPVFQLADAQPVMPGGLAPLTSLAPMNEGRTITGRVILNGKPPAENPIQPDPTCGRENANLKTTRFYVVSTNGGLANVFVYISGGLEGKRFATPREPVVLDQQGCLFEPYILGLMVNQKLRITNSDPALHNVHATPLSHDGNREFNVAEGPGSSVTKNFSAPEMRLRIWCDVHPWMFAYVNVMEHPFFAVTDADGRFSITNVPPGDYVLEAYHLKAHGIQAGETRKIHVTSEAATVANFVIQSPAALRRIAQSK